MKQTDRIQRARVAIDYTLRTPGMQKELNRVGFTKADVQRGKTLLAKVQLLDAAQQKEYGDRYQATDALAQARQQAREQYMQHLEVARLALKNQRGIWKTLEMNGARKTNLFGWLAQARTFYHNAELVASALAQYNITEAELQQGASMVEAVMEAYDTRQQEDREAQQATRQRNNAMDELKAWMRRFTLSAQLAFAEDPATLKELGLVSRVGV